MQLEPMRSSVISKSINTLNRDKVYYLPPVQTAYIYTVDADFFARMIFLLISRFRL